jgi:hypothetical protein
MSKTGFTPLRNIASASEAFFRWRDFGMAKVMASPGASHY